VSALRLFGLMVLSWRLFFGLFLWGGPLFISLSCCCQKNQIVCLRRFFAIFSYTDYKICDTVRCSPLRASVEKNNILKVSLYYYISKDK